MAEQVASRRGVMFGALLLGAGVAVALGVYGRVHGPDFAALPSWGFSGPGAFKSWTASVVLVLALVQLVTALWLYGKLGARRVPACDGEKYSLMLFDVPLRGQILLGIVKRDDCGCDAHQRGVVRSADDIEMKPYILRRPVASGYRLDQAVEIVAKTCYLLLSCAFRSNRGDTRLHDQSNFQQLRLGRDPFSFRKRTRCQKSISA